MRQVDPSVPRFTEEGVKLLLGDRRFGDKATTLEIVNQMPVPKEMRALGDALRRDSKLLSLAQGSGAREISAAYGADLALLLGYCDDFRATIKAAVRARIVEGEDVAQVFMDEIAKQISAVDFTPSLELGAETARNEPEVLLQILQQHFHTDVARLEQAVTTWLHLLVEQDVVSLVDWINDEAVYYHFITAHGVSEKLDLKVADPGMKLGGRYVKITERNKNDVYIERRIHTVLDATRHSLAEYRQRVPQRVARFIDSVPPRIKQFITIIDGTVSSERVRRDLGSTQISETTRSVWVPDPAGALFNIFALTGWGGSSQEPSRSRYRGHALSRADRWLLGEVIAMAAVILLAFTRGPREAIAVGVLALILTVGHQISLRSSPNK